MKWYKSHNTGRIILAAVIAGYLSIGVYSLQSGQEAVILFWGKDVRHNASPGLGFHLPFPFEKAVKVNVRQMRTVIVGDEKGKGVECFTGDENLLLIRSVVNYDVADAGRFLFGSADLGKVISTAAKKCIVEELSSMFIDDIMTTGKTTLRLSLKDKIQAAADSLNLGVRVLSVELTDISPPSNASGAFMQVSDAREKKQRIIREAEGYANTVIPQARGEADSLSASAEAYRAEALNRARAETEAFNALLKEYLKNPSVNARITYLQYLQKIYSRCNVTIDSNPGSSVYYIDGSGKMFKLDGGEN